MQTLQVVYRRSVKLYFYEIFRICANNEIHVVPVWQKQFLNYIDDVG